MPVQKGKDWGHPGVLPDGAPVASSDRDIVKILLRQPHPVIGVNDGDVATTLGIRKPFDPTTPKHLVKIDTIEVELADGTTASAVAHIVVGHPVFSSESVAVMNAAFWQGRNIAPRAHPGDGKVDIVHFRLSATDRFKARRRMMTGTHVPHPGITVRRCTSGEVEIDKPRPVWVDGDRLGRAASLRFQVVPESLTIGVS